MTWEKYKDFVKVTDEQGRCDIEEMENLASVVSEFISRRGSLDISQRSLVDRCGEVKLAVVSA